MGTIFCVGVTGRPTDCREGEKENPTLVGEFSLLIFTMGLETRNMAGKLLVSHEAHPGSNLSTTYSF